MEEKFCPRPWTHIELRRSLDVGLCSCEGWLPESVGNMQSDEHIFSLFNSEKAKRIRRTILEGSFAYCNKEACPYLRMRTLPDKKDILGKEKVIWNGTNVANDYTRKIIRQNIVTAPAPRFYQLCYDETCNLSCPSCRSGFISIHEGAVYRAKQEVQEKFYREVLAKPMERWAIINMCGTGDPFASRLYQQLLQRIDGKTQPRLKISFQTNGLLFTSRVWERLNNIHENILDILVSCDAASETTYLNVRRGGNWTTLMKNLEFISSLRHRREIKGLFRLDFVVQKRNYNEMVDFITIAKAFKVDAVQFHAVQPYLENSEMTYGRGYDEHAVWRPSHPEHERFLQVLADPAFNDPLVNLGVLALLRTVNCNQTEIPTSAGLIAIFSRQTKKFFSCGKTRD